MSSKNEKNVDACEEQPDGRSLMKVLTYTEYGGPEVYRVQRRSIPEAGDGQILVRIHYSMVTATEAIFRRGTFLSRLFTGLFRPGLQVLGEEFAGTVVVSRSEAFREGDRVFGITGPEFGAHAQYVVLPESAVIQPVPEGVAFEEAVACLDGFLTAFPFLRDVGGLQAGQKVLINGASGSVGSAAVQIAHRMGAEVTGICSEGNHPMVRSLGASHVIDYHRHDFTESGKTYDLILDTVGNLTFRRCKRVLTDTGILLQASIRISVLPVVLWTSFFSKKKVRIAATGLRKPAEKLEDMKTIATLVKKGDFTAVVDRIMGMDDIVEAHRYVDTGRKRGNLLLRMT